MSDKPVRVRIAPSPTGYLHVGTGRMAIANYLFARHYGGQFLVRIEDTDQERSKSELVEPILNAFRWLGLDWDEEIVYQSTRSDKYKESVAKLLENGHAYKSYATQEELQAAREKARAEKRPRWYFRENFEYSDVEIKRREEAGLGYAVRLAIPEGETQFDDMVSGTLSRSSNDIEDLIIARSNGTATYNLAVVVDDHDMGITHVIRGNDHIANTFKQIHLYRALGWEIPIFGHVPLILRPDKKKVSKRLGDKDVYGYKDDGILPEALFNFLSLLGWSTKTDQEIFDRDELINIFDENNFNTSNAVFDETKLLSFNQEHIKRKSDHDLATLVAPMIVEADVYTKYGLETRWEYLRAVVGLLKGRVNRLSDMVGLSRYFFDPEFEYDEKADGKYFGPDAIERLEKLADRFEAVEKFTTEAAEQALTLLSEELGINKAQLIHPSRLAVSGMPSGPGLYDILVILTQAEVVRRMRQAADYIRNKRSNE